MASAGPSNIVTNLFSNEHSDGLEAARRAVANREYPLARRILSERVRIESEPLETWLMLASVCRASGDFIEALLVLDRTLARAPRHFLALLMRASILDRLGHPDAAEAYGLVLRLCPDPSMLDAATQKALARASMVNEAHVGRLEHAMREAGKSLLSDASIFEKWSLDRFITDALRPQRRYRQEPVQFFYPGLPAIEFYDRTYFPWLEDLEAHWETIRDELLETLEASPDDFTPYVNYPDSVPLDQWRDLNGNRNWSAYHLIERGRHVQGQAPRCPRTLEILSSLPQPQIKERGPAAMFSALNPHTRIPPHTGISNTRLVVHLPLIVPENCGFRVGNETRSWIPGQAFVFDDTIEHEAWNESDEVRIILIFDIWSPFLTGSQRALITNVTEAMDREIGPRAGPLPSMQL
jgi:aspartate beta-hydroxylase